MSYESKAQISSLNPNDTICPTVRVYQNLLIGAQQSVELKKQIKDMEERIANLQQVIADFQWMDSMTVATYESQITELNTQKAILEKLLRKERRKTRFVGIVGILVSAAAFYIGGR